MYPPSSPLPNWIISLIGAIAATCTTIAFVPQLISVYRLKTARDISLSMFVIFSLGVFLWLLYGFFIHSVSIVVANGFTLILSLAILVLKVHYDRKPGDATLLRK